MAALTMALLAVQNFGAPFFDYFSPGVWCGQGGRR